MSVEQTFALECQANTQPTVLVTYALFSVALRGNHASVCFMLTCTHTVLPSSVLNTCIHMFSTLDSRELAIISYDNVQVFVRNFLVNLLLL